MHAADSFISETNALFALKLVTNKLDIKQRQHSHQGTITGINTQ